MKSSGFDIEGSHVQSLCHHHNNNDCVRLVLPRMNLYQRKRQADSGAQAWQEGYKPVQIRTGLYLPVPCEPYQPIPN